MTDHLLLFSRIVGILKWIHKRLIVSKSCPIEAIDKGASLLVFEFVEECIRNIDPFVANADLILCLPKIPSAL
jgi:hypothetical protein